MARVLLVDDDDILRDLFRMFLEAEGIEVEEAENGEQATRVMDGGQFDLIIVDVMMPVMDGIRFLEWLRDHKGRRPPVIVLSATPPGNADVELKALGAVSVIRKPVEPDELLAEVKSALG